MIPVVVEEDLARSQAMEARDKAALYRSLTVLVDIVIGLFSNKVQENIIRTLEER